MSALDEVLTLMEAAQRWRVPASTLRHYAAGYRRSDGSAVEPVFTAAESRKSAGTLLVTKSGMRRVFGEEPKPIEYVQTALFD